MYLEIASLIFGIFLLYYGSEILVKNSTWLAKSLGVAPLVVGMTVVAFGTSAPELLVSTVASVQGNSAIALGNVIGSNIANIGLVLGLIVLIWPPKAEPRAVRKEFPFLIAVSVLLFFLAMDGSLGRIDGSVLIILFVLFIYYNIMTVRRKLLSKLKHDIKELEEKVEDTIEDIAHRDLIEHKKRKRKIIRNLGFSLAGLALLLLGSKFLVDSSISIAQTFGVSQMVIGLSLVAIGTSLPELFTAVIASIKKQEEINVGMVLGSNIFNTLLILGVAAIILPIPVAKQDIYVSIPIMLFFTVLAFPILKENIRTNRLFGLFMILGYFGFIIYSFIR